MLGDTLDASHDHPQSRNWGSSIRNQVTEVLQRVTQQLPVSCRRHPRDCPVERIADELDFWPATTIVWER